MVFHSWNTGNFITKKSRGSNYILESDARLRGAIREWVSFKLQFCTLVYVHIEGEWKREEEKRNDLNISRDIIGFAYYLIFFFHILKFNEVKK